MKLRVLLAPVALAAALAAGCGGGGEVSKEDFEARMGSIGDTIASSFEELAQSAPTAGSLDELSGQLDTVQAALDDAAAEVQELEFPDDVASTKATLVEGVEGLSADVQRLIDAVEAGDLESIEAVAQEFQSLDLSSLEEIQGAIDEIRAAGYDVSGGE